MRYVFMCIMPILCLACATQSENQNEVRETSRDCQWEPKADTTLYNCTWKEFKVPESQKAAALLQGLKCNSVYSNGKTAQYAIEGGIRWCTPKMP